ncbi:hypothetical protein ABMA27_001081 [Loxostege sticticalis]|uniref:Aminopeptidase n=1 Tax=Loxostege sticticalis TaxID=481309 RepID=A0ABR3I1G2_LOXSC
MSLKVIFICSLVLTLTNQLPIAIKNEKLTNIVPELIANVNSERSENVTVSGRTSDRTLVRSAIRPGMIADNYAVELDVDVDGGTYSGRVSVRVNINDPNTLEDEITFHAAGISVDSVEFAVGGSNTFVEANHHQDDDGLLRISTGQTATLYRFMIGFEGNLDPSIGLFSGSYGDGNSYVAMNLHPTNARRVFPCIDELTALATITLSVNGLGDKTIISNTEPENTDNGSPTVFRPLAGPVHLLGMMAHDFATITNPVTGAVNLLARRGITGQENRASIAINSYFTFLNAWTEKNFENIITFQNAMMSVIAVPDVSINWHALTIVGVWEPYLLMPNDHAVMQRKIALVEIADAMARQWFGYVIYPQNWIFNWILTGLGTYSAYEAVRNLQPDPNGEDNDFLDVNAMFLTDVIQESLLYDSYSNNVIQALQPAPDVIGNGPEDERQIRQVIYGLPKYKAPAVMSMISLALGNEERDPVKTAARGLFITRTLEHVNDRHFIDNLETEYADNGDGLVPDVTDFVGQYTTRTGYPVVRVAYTQGLGVTLIQRHFGFTTPTPQQNFLIPISFTRSIEPDFDNIYPSFIMDQSSFVHNLDIGEEDDWVIYNIQGRGYYRVCYDPELMSRLIGALDDPERREEIHPLNRATLIDDSLNIARRGGSDLIDYETALPMILTMQHETEYAPWKAFVRSMDFIRKRLVALVEGDEDLDPDIYLRMVQRTVVAVENEIGFSPSIPLAEPAMTSLTRGIVMDHACRSGYQPCIAAAVDWFYSPNAEEDTVNPQIPNDMRPAVYCTMVREDGERARDALNNRLEDENVMYERIVILESLACSPDEEFINGYLERTIADDSPYSVEERVKIFKAIAGASRNNARLAIQFLSREGIVNEVRARYGGDAKLEEILYALAENMVDGGLVDLFREWVQRGSNGLGESEDVANRALNMVNQDMEWVNRDLGTVYDWIDENDATTAALSMFLICLTFALTLLNH